MCSAKLRKGVRFCWKCNADQTSAGPPNENTSSGQQQESFGRPQMGQKRKAAKIEKKVSVNIGIKVISPKGLKIVRGKRLPVTVLQQSTYAALLEQAIQKWSAYDKNFDQSKEYVLLYDDDRCAQFMPGKRYSYIPVV